MAGQYSRASDMDSLYGNDTASGHGHEETEMETEAIKQADPSRVPAGSRTEHQRTERRSNKTEVDNDNMEALSRNSGHTRHYSVGSAMPMQITEAQIAAIKNATGMQK